MSILKYKRVVVQLDSKEQTVTLPKNRTPREPFKMMVSKVSFFSGAMLVFRGLLKLLYSSPMSFLASYKKTSVGDFSRVMVVVCEWGSHFLWGFVEFLLIYPPRN